MECLLPVLWTIVYASICSRLTYAENFGNFKNILWSTCLESRKEALYFMKLSVQQCINECALRSDCEFLSYDMRLHRCGLYFNEDFNNKDEKGGTCAFIFRRDLDLQEITSVCSCNDGQVCSLNNRQCLIKECQPFYFDNGFVYGNVRQVHAKRRIKCHDGYREINGVQEVTCNNDGNWSYLPSCVLQSSSTATTKPGPTTEKTTTGVETTYSTTTTTTVGVTISTAATTATTGAQTPPSSTTTTPSQTTVSSATTMAVTTTTTTTTVGAPTTPSPTTTTITTTTPSPTTLSSATTMAETTTTTLATTTTNAATETVCPSNFSQWITPSADNTSFQVLFVVQTAKQPESETGCAGHSSSLVKIDELWKQNALKALLGNCEVFIGYSSSCYWIDGFSIESTWTFKDLIPMPMSSEFWDAGQPSSSGGQNCVSINSNQLWENKNCNNACGYICERTVT